MNQVILNEGSIHSHSAGEDLNQNRDLPLVLREDFAKICFETLLQYSLLDQMRWKLNTMSLQRSPS